LLIILYNLKISINIWYVILYIFNVNAVARRFASLLAQNYSVPEDLRIFMSSAKSHIAD